MLTAFADFDTAINGWILNLPHPVILNIFFVFFSAKGVYVFIWTIIFLYLIAFEGKRNKTFIIYFIMSILMTAFSVTMIKHFTKRPRPLSQIKNEKMKIKNYPTDYSFPSGHAAISFAAATVLSPFDKKRKKYFYLIASIIAFSRVYLGYHYVADVVIGALLGWLISESLLLRLKMKNYVNTFNF